MGWAKQLHVLISEPEPQENKPQRLLYHRLCFFSLSLLAFGERQQPLRYCNYPIACFVSFGAKVIPKRNSVPRTVKRSEAAVRMNDIQPVSNNRGGRIWVNREVARYRIGEVMLDAAVVSMTLRHSWSRVY